MLTANGRNQLLDSSDVAYLGLHTAYPGESGTNECSGGSPAYARKSVTFAAASGGSRATSTAPVFDVASGTTVRWIGYWTAVTAGSMRACAPNGGSPKEFQVDVTNNRILCEGHGYSADQKIVFYGGTPPTGLTAGTVYFVRTPTSADPDHFEVSTTAGGAAIDLTGQPGADCVVSIIVEETYGAQGTFTATSGQTTLSLNG
jgi:hypothetical protein